MKFLLLIAFGVVAILAEESNVLKNFAEGNLQFIGELYKELVKTNHGNFLVCPLSVQTVFALVNSGAKGNTAKQITTGLHLPEGEDKIKQTFLLLGESLQTSDKYTLSSANKVYVDNDFKISNQYKSTAVNVFHSEIQNIDFTKSEQAAAEINKWVEEKTHDKIKNLVKEEMFSQDTALVLINALYFQGKWVKEFGEIITLPFTSNKNSFVITNMMTISDDFNYYNSPELNAQFLELPYKGDEVTMTIVLPKETEGLSTLETRISDVLVAPKYQLERVSAIIPKFKVKTTIPFIPILQALGITDAFSSTADFSGIGEGGEQLVISEVVQKAFIEVDEKGTTAAAATAVVFDRIVGGNEKEFIADHPFLFYLKHKVAGVFFIGRYAIAEAAAGGTEFQ